MDLIERQLKLEKDHSTQGVVDAMNKFKADVAAGRMADTGVGRNFTLRAYQLVQDALEELCAAGTRGVGGRYRTLVREVGLDACAVLALRTGLNLLSQPRQTSGSRVQEPLVQDFLSTVGPACEAEWMLKKLQLAAPGYMHRVVQSMDEAHTRSQNHRRRTLRASARNVGVEEVTWATSEQVGVGRLLLEATVQSGVFELGSQPKGKGQSWVTLVASDVTRTNLERMTSMLKGFTTFPPMLIKPREHTLDTLFHGASYHGPELSGLCASIGTRTRRKDHRDWIKSNLGELPVLAANKAAQQPYKIDVETASLLRDLFAKGVYNGIAGIPSLEPVTPPEYPLASDWDREDEELQETHAAWKAVARKAHGDEIVRRSHVMAFRQTLQYLGEYSEDVLYFPTFFDWRGRLYFRSRVNPQGTDTVKAMLQFADKKPLGKRGLYWLKVAVATSYGFDKKSMDTRAVWTDENMDVIRDAVVRHVDSDFFRLADSPWCFYVAARELIRALDSGNPEAWESGVPVAMDATCSGMQHLSALLRDPVGGMFTNLLPNHGDEKEDIYSGVAGISVAAIQKDRDNPEQAQYWLNVGVPRSMAKRPVMTYVYGGTLMSCTEYVYVEMQSRGLPRTENYSEFKLASYLSKNLRKGIEATVPSSAECMRFLRGLASKVPVNEAMKWRSPAGFPVVQHYAQEEVTRLNLPALGVKLNMIRFNDDLSNRAKCVNGIAPNFVHSLDSAHLVRVIVAYAGQLVPIHDSFATHPCDVDELHKVLRSEFVSMYRDADPLATLAAGVDPDIELPTRGTLDIELVNQSEFFMC